MELDTQLNASDRTTRETISKNFREIQNTYDDLNRSLNRLNTRLDNLNKQKATHDEVKAAKDEWKNKIEHVALGTDYETVEQAVMQILKEKGMI
ncbi:hypothetical protein [Limosilactobacillus balticus]|uniref:hypothetical protein n=1 Tax=Limosilactobacillus balticus TaxID=2759747 RepID=UPI001E5061AE|nr:hypothetical protein [Limosilactobacillus balticus]MCD7133294.1 hypothetical protein [Limosilactobacillus balticus]